MKHVMFCALAAAAVSTTALGQLIPNAGFETVGPLGNPVVTNSGGGEASAAAGWTTFRPVASPITTELLTSTNTLPGGGGLMLRLTTVSGFSGSAANGVFCNLLAAATAGASGSIDLLAEPNVAFTLGFVGASGAFESSINAVGTGSWQRFNLLVTGGPVGAFGIEINSGQGGTVFLDNASLIPAPGAAALLGLGGLVASRRRRA